MWHDPGDHMWCSRTGKHHNLILSKYDKYCKIEFFFFFRKCRTNDVSSSLLVQVFSLPFDPLETQVQWSMESFSLKSLLKATSQVILKEERYDGVEHNIWRTNKYTYTIHISMYVYIYLCMHACMDGWMDGWMDAWTCMYYMIKHIYIREGSTWSIDSTFALPYYQCITDVTY